MKLGDALLLGLGAVGTGFALSRVLAPGRHALRDVASSADPAGPSVLDSFHPTQTTERSPVIPIQTPAPRGLVLGLSPQQIVNRALYLAGELSADKLDSHVRDPAPECATIFYRLAYPNGGTDPTARNPAAYWWNDAHTFEFVTSDCIAGACWNAGIDRLQKARALAGYGPKDVGVVYGGAFNTDSMLADARGRQVCFKTIPVPIPGCFVVCASGSPGHKVGHIMTATKVPSNWDPTKRASWQALEGVDIANRKDAQGNPARANKRTTGAGWYGTGASFVVSIMAP